MEALTQSKYRAFRGCPRYFFHKYEQRLDAKGQRDGLRRGTIFGSCLFAVEQAQSDGTLLDGSISPTVRESIWEVIRAKLELYYSSVEITSQEQADALQLEEVKVGVMANAYVNRYGIDQRREVVYDLPLVNPITGRQSRTFRRAGKIDGIISLGNRHALVIEDKFTQQISKAAIDRLPLDEQITEYVDALAALDWTAEVAFRHTRYPSINPEKAKEFKTKPNRQAEDLTSFGQRLEVDVADRPEFYFDEQRLMFSQEWLEAHRHARWRTAKDILRARRDAKSLPIEQAYPTHSWRCLEYGGCEFIPLCTHMEGAAALYEVRELEHPELHRL